MTSFKSNVKSTRTAEKLRNQRVDLAKPADPRKHTFMHAVSPPPMA